MKIINEKGKTVNFYKYYITEIHYFIIETERIFGEDCTLYFGHAASTKNCIVLLLCFIYRFNLSLSICRGFLVSCITANIHPVNSVAINRFFSFQQEYLQEMYKQINFRCIYIYNQILFVPYKGVGDFRCTNFIFLHR